MKVTNMFHFFAIVFFSSFAFTSCTDEDTPSKDAQLSSEEIFMLQYMREEEKLAQDVYTYLSSLYTTNIFSNIAASEQKHVGFVLDMMNTYEIDDIGSSEAGIFKNSELQTLYNDLTGQGNLSLVEALKVGATIEDLDIFDLRTYKSRTQNTDLIWLFDLLECGSRNHFRAFAGRLSDNEVSYEPQFLNQADYNDIINGSHESCN